MDEPAGIRLTPALRAVVDWSDADFYLGTAQGEQRWNRFWASVRVTRRTYARACAAMGLLLGAGAGWVVATDAVEPGDHVFSMVVAYLTVPALAWWWGWLLRWSIAPAFLRNAQRVARIAYVLLGILVLVVSPLFAAHPVGWGIAGGTLVALPWLASAVIETRRRIPPYPAAWKKFDSG